MRFFTNLCACLLKRFKRGGGRGGAADDPEDEVVDSFDIFFELRALQIATNFFSELNKLGHGGFGPVYKVSYTLLEN